MSKPTTSSDLILVHLVQSGSEPRDFHLTEGSTVADLLRASGIATTSPNLWIDGIPIEEAMPLVEGSIVTTVLSDGTTTENAFWGPPITAFQDEQLCREYREALEANRRKEVHEPEESIE